MKYLSILSILLLTAFACSSLAAEEGNDHEHDHAKVEGRKQAGPNGGRVITSAEPHLEIWMKPDRFLQITALGEDSKASSLAQQSVRLIGGDRADPIRMTFVKKDNLLVSDKPVPAGNNMPVVLQIKVNPDSKTIIEKFYLNLNHCGGCKYKEYACICDH